MSGVLTAVRPRTRARAAYLDGDVVGVVLTGAVLAALAIVAWGTWGDLGRDTGYDFVAATRVAHGQLPYVDFVYYYGPLAPFATGLAALIGGNAIGSFVALGLVLSIAIVFATYALARTLTGPVGATFASVATAAVAFSPTNLSFVLPHTYSVTFAILLALLFLLGLSAASQGRSSGVPFAGVAAGLVALTRPEFEAAVLAAAAVWLVARARGGKAGKREAAKLLVPAAVVPALVYGAFLASVSPHRLFFENLYPVDTLRAGGSAIVRAQAPLTLHSFALVVGYLALYAIGCAGLVAASQGLRRLRPAVATAVIAGVGIAILGVSVADPEAIRSKLQWVFGGVPAAAAIAAVFLVIRHLVRRRPLDAQGQVLVATIALLAVLAAKTYSGFFLFADHAQPAMYAAPFVLVALARLHTTDLARSRTAMAAGTAWLAVLALICVGLTVKDARAQSAAVTGPGGTLRVSSAEAPLFRAALGAIASGTKQGDAILVAPQLTALYTLSRRTDPLRQISLVPGALAGTGDEAQAIRSLARVRFAITDRHTFGEYGQTRFGASFDRLLAGWIGRHFNHVATLRTRGGVDHTLDVWMRRAR